MKKNPANQIKDTMWAFLMDHGQQANIPALKEDIDWDELDMTLMSIVIEATALVLSGDLERSKQ